jgi:hypothetical protein
VHEPDREGTTARTRTVRVRVRVEAELTAPPADEQAESEVDDDEADRSLRRLLNPLRKSGAEEEDRKTEREQRRRMPKAPGEAELPGATSGALLSARHERRHGDEVIRVGRMTESEKDRDSENDPDRSAVGGCGESLVEAEHRITAPTSS